MTSNKTTNYNLYIRSFIRYKKGVCISGIPSRYMHKYDIRSFISQFLSIPYTYSQFYYILIYIGMYMHKYDIRSFI